jgi:hypothetical protein
MLLTTLVLAALALPQAPAGKAPAAPAKAVPMIVQVEAPAKADEGTQAWARELRAALQARPDEFRLARAGE